jgi:hypothetical protein
MVIARRFLRIDVWPRYPYARGSAGPGAKVFGRMTVWPRGSVARQHMVYGGSGASVLLESGDYVLLEAGDHILLEAA